MPGFGKFCRYAWMRRGCGTQVYYTILVYSQNYTVAQCNAIQLYRSTALRYRGDSLGNATLVSQVCDKAADSAGNVQNVEGPQTPATAIRLRSDTIVPGAVGIPLPHLYTLIAEIPAWQSARTWSGADAAPWSASGGRRAGRGLPSGQS